MSIFFIAYYHLLRKSFKSRKKFKKNKSDQLVALMSYRGNENKIRTGNSSAGRPKRELMPTRLCTRQRDRVAVEVVVEEGLQGGYLNLRRFSLKIAIMKRCFP